MLTRYRIAMSSTHGPLVWRGDALTRIDAQVRACVWAENRGARLLSIEKVEVVG
jgi:hypothetical protein